VHKRLGEEIAINYCENKSTEECSLTREKVIEGGYLSDWRQLSGFHYRSYNAGASRGFLFKARG